MGGNTLTAADPADGDFDDWFELYNAGTNAVDLANYTLTDDLENPTKYSIPAGTIVPAGGFLLVWADEEDGQNVVGQDLHVNFKLAQAGEQLGLFAPDGSLVDSVSFGPQPNDVSLGRFPDGAELPLYEMVRPTPRGPNTVAGANRPPRFEPVPEQVVAEGSLLVFTVQATDPDAGETVRYSLGAGAPGAATLDERTGEFRWTPGESDGPARVNFVIEAEDNGTPARVGTVRVTVQVTEVNEPPRLDPIPNQVVDEGTLLALDLIAHDPDLPANQLVYTLAPGAPEAASVTGNGHFTWIPNESKGGTSVVVTVRVSDLGSPEYTDTATFRIDILDVPNPPAMPPIPPQVVAEGTPLNLRIEAVDPDMPPSPLVFSLETAPPGATVDPASGQLHWLPGEEFGPTNAVFVVRATEVWPPGLSSVATFTVTVNEVNQPPVLFPIADQSCTRRPNTRCPGPSPGCRFATTKPPLFPRPRQPSRPVHRPCHRLDRVAGRSRPGSQHRRHHRARHRRRRAAAKQSADVPHRRRASTACRDQRDHVSPANERHGVHRVGEQLSQQRRGSRRCATHRRQSCIRFPLRHNARARWLPVGGPQPCRLRGRLRRRLAHRRAVDRPPGHDRRYASG